VGLWPAAQEGCERADAISCRSDLRLRKAEKATALIQVPSVLIRSQASSFIFATVLVERVLVLLVIVGLTLLFAVAWSVVLSPLRGARIQCCLRNCPRDDAKAGPSLGGSFGLPLVTSSRRLPNTLAPGDDSAPLAFHGSASTQIPRRAQNAPRLGMFRRGRAGPETVDRAGGPAGSAVPRSTR
jgi:hypothetical protein